MSDCRTLRESETFAREEDFVDVAVPSDQKTDDVWTALDESCLEEAPQRGLATDDEEDRAQLGRPYADDGPDGIDRVFAEEGFADLLGC